MYKIETAIVYSTILYLTYLIMSIQLQLVINKLSLFYEMLDIIKSFCFYDKKTYNIIQNAKLQKNQLIHAISIAITRANNFDNIPEYSDDDGHWMFGYIHNITDKIQMQADNCYYCGNYIQYKYRGIHYHSDVIHCQCIQDADHYIDELYDSDED